jgi:hypothetical protein
MNKKQIRAKFRKKVFNRDGYKCRVCGINGIDRQSEKYNCQVIIDGHPTVFLSEDEYWNYEATFCELNRHPPDGWEEAQRIIRMRLPALDAHHITPREKMPNGGYVKENGISLCPECHIKAEDYLHGVMYYFDDYAPTDLYKLINSSYELALEKSKKL